MRRIVGIGVVMLLLGGCAGSGAPAPNVVPRLVTASDTLPRQCANAAEQLGFAVPCPRRVPALPGKATGCSTPTPCVGLAGERQSSIFFVDFSGFDVPSGYAGIDGKPEGHVIIEARRDADSPPLPCFDGVERGTESIVGRRVTRYACPGRSARMERLIRHGEGAHAGHLLFEWSESEIDYVASAHGDTATNARLLEQIVESIDLVDPTQRG